MSTEVQTEARAADVRRRTKETDVRVRLVLDGGGAATVSTGVAFLDNMLELFARHGLFDLEVECRGDLHIDDHHSVEDVAITLGQARAQALGDKAGSARHGEAAVPIDEALCRAAVELSGRFYLVYDVHARRQGRRSFSLV